MFRSALCALACFSVFASNSAADIGTVTIETVDSGMLNGLQFLHSPISFSATYDTDEIVEVSPPPFGRWDVPMLWATITIDGIGTADMVDSGYIESATSFGQEWLLLRFRYIGTEFWAGGYAHGDEPYDLTYALDPVELGMVRALGYPGEHLNTSAGLLIIRPHDVFQGVGYVEMDTPL
jgi:hypothetical protein